MPRIDPTKLLGCLSVLLAPNGGIRNAGEVRRLASLMAKFSKKLVSKCIYIQILKCTETELLGQFMQTGGWSLVHMWLVDGISSENWPLIQELLELLLCCPVDMDRLKLNSTPKLIKTLATKCEHDSVRVLATKLIEQWLHIVKAPKQQSEMSPTDETETSAGMNAKENVAMARGQSGKTNGDVRHQNGNGNGDAVGETGSRKTFQKVGEQEAAPHKKTSLVLKITTKNGKQVVAKVVSRKGKRDRDPLETDERNGDQEYEEDDEGGDDGDQEEVLVNIESSTTVVDGVTHQVVGKEAKKHDLQNGIEGGKERDPSKDKDRHHSHREKDRKGGTGSGGSHSSSSRLSGGSGSSGSNSSSKHKSSSKSSSSSSSSSRSKDKDRHGSSSSSKSKGSSSSASSSSKSNGSSSRSSSSSDKHREHREKSSHSSSRDGKDSKGQSVSPSSKLARKSSKDDGSHDSGSETSSTMGSNGAKSLKPASATIPSKKASISIEVRNPENRPKTVKTYNSQFRSHGLIEEAPPPPSRKGLKKPSSSSASATVSSPSTTGTTNVASSDSGTVKRSSPMPSGREAAAAGSPVEKRPKEDLQERPGSIKLIPAKRQHALIESDMFMDALSATLRKDVKKRKRRTSGSESTAPVVGKPADVPATKPSATEGGSTTSKGATTATESSTTAAGKGDEPAADAVSAPTTPTSPKVPTIAPMSFYRDTLAESEEDKGTDSAEGATKDPVEDDGNDAEARKDPAEDDPVDDDEEPIVKKPKRAKCELNEDEDAETGKEKKDLAEGEDDKIGLLDAVMSDVEKKIAEEAEDSSMSKEEGENVPPGKKPPGPGCGPDGPPGVLVIHRRKGPKKQLRWRAAEDLEEVRYFELDVTERCNVTKSFTDMKQMERVDERQKFMLSRKVGSEDIMVERTAWRPLLVVDNVPVSPDGSQSLERAVQRQRERGCLQALYFNKHMIPDSPVEPDPADIYQTADPMHIPLEDVTGNPDSVNDFTGVSWPDPKSTPPHESAVFNSPFFPTDMPPGAGGPIGAGFGPGGFPPPFAPGASNSLGPGPWNLGPPGGNGPRPNVLPPGMFPLNQPPPGLVGVPPVGGGGGSPNLLNLPLNLPPNVPPPGIFPGPTNFNAPPPELTMLPGDGAGRVTDFRNGPPPQQWVSNNRTNFAGNNPGRGGIFGNRGGNSWNNRNNGANPGGNRNGPGDRARMGDDNRGGNYRGHWTSNNRGHNNGNRGSVGGARKW